MPTPQRRSKTGIVSSSLVGRSASRFSVGRPFDRPEPLSAVRRALERGVRRCARFEEVIASTANFNPRHGHATAIFPRRPERNPHWSKRFKKATHAFQRRKESAQTLLAFPRTRSALAGIRQTRTRRPFWACGSWAAAARSTRSGTSRSRSASRTSRPRRGLLESCGGSSKAGRRGFPRGRTPRRVVEGPPPRGRTPRRVVEGPPPRGRHRPRWRRRGGGSRRRRGVPRG